jgi:hypothetical protein
MGQSTPGGKNSAPSPVCLLHWMRPRCFFKQTAPDSVCTDSLQLQFNVHVSRPLCLGCNACSPWLRHIFETNVQGPQREEVLACMHFSPRGMSTFTVQLIAMRTYAELHAMDDVWGKPINFKLAFHVPVEVDANLASVNSTWVCHARKCGLLPWRIVQ